MEDMDLELSREEIMEMVQFMRTVLTTDELLEGIPLEQKLAEIPPEKRLELAPDTLWKNGHSNSSISGWFGRF